MQKHIKTLFKAKFFYIIAIGITILIAFLSLIKLKETKINILHLDKIEHAIAYTVLTLSWLFAIKKAYLLKSVRYLVAVGCVFFGIIIEVLQTTITSYRTASYLDVLANLIGVSIALLIFNLNFKKI